MEEEQALAIMVERGQELLALTKAFEENGNPPDERWMAECMAATLALMRRAKNRQQRLDAISVLTVAMWQKGYEAMDRLQLEA